MRRQAVIRTISGILLVFFYVIKFAVSIRWLSVASVAIQTPETCDNISGLINRQRKICRGNLHIMDSVTQGALKALDECQFQFKNRRWNCSLFKPESIFGHAIAKGTRESAFLHAISAAGVAHAVTRSCASGSLHKCGCDRSVRGRAANGFKWAGCSDNIAYGKAFSKRFVDSRERKRGKRARRALVNLHNNNAGRITIENYTGMGMVMMTHQTIEEYMKKRCKCHGVSGSCELKTCWRGMPNFRTVGEKLKEKFDGATEVIERAVNSRKQLVPTNAFFKPHTSSDLVYLVESPDFCVSSRKAGTVGTSGRLCNETSKAIDGCELLCCNRGYITKRKVMTERCHCKFHWCCQVRCDTCRREILEHRCV